MESSAIKLFDSVFVIPGPTNVGCVAFKKSPFSKKQNIFLIDSGMDKDDAARIYKELELLFPKKNGGFLLKAVINTHSHADHAGGNAWFVEKTGCEIWISEKESGSLVNNLLQASVTCGGHPMPHLQTSYYIPEVSYATKIISEKSFFKLPNGAKISFVALPGHYFEMLGVVYTNKEGKRILFPGDAIFGREHLFKYWISFMYDVEYFLSSLDVIDSFKADWYVPSHGTAVQRIDEIVELNKIAIFSTLKSILVSLNGDVRKTQEQILKDVADQNEIKFRTAQYLLIGCTIRAYLYYLYDHKKIDCVIKENMLYWYKIAEL